MRLQTPDLFSFEEVLVYLSRSRDETLYGVTDNRVIRLVELCGQQVVVDVTCEEKGWLDITVSDDSTESIREAAVRYVREWFDLDRDLTPFYTLAAHDPILHSLVDAFYGLRLVGVPDLFEALCWAIIGQQINLPFAYTLKRRFVERFGVSRAYQNVTLRLFPRPERIACLGVADLQTLQLSTRKAEYIIGVAREMTSDRLSKRHLVTQTPDDAMQTLTRIRGIGEWTASYVAMRCLRDHTAFPLGDVGLQNAVKAQLHLGRKPTRDELLSLRAGWRGWEAYATFYLWRSLQGLSA